MVKIPSMNSGLSLLNVDRSDHITDVGLHVKVHTHFLQQSLFELLMKKMSSAKVGWCNASVAVSLDCTKTHVHLLSSKWRESNTLRDHTFEQNIPLQVVVQGLISEEEVVQTWFQLEK